MEPAGIEPATSCLQRAQPTRLHSAGLQDFSAFTGTFQNPLGLLGFAGFYRGFRPRMGVRGLFPSGPRAARLLPLAWEFERRVDDREVGDERGAA